MDGRDIGTVNGGCPVAACVCPGEFVVLKKIHQHRVTIRLQDDIDRREDGQFFVAQE